MNGPSWSALDNGDRAIHRRGLEQEWYQFRDSAFEEIAKDWLEANGIEYE